VTDLERALLELEIDWPATPDLAGAVRARLAAGEPARPGVRGLRARRTRRRLRTRLAWVAATLAVLAGGTLAASPAARSDVLRWLGLKSVVIHRAPPSATPVPPARRSPLGESLGLGRAVTLAEARRISGRPVLAPASLGTPGAVYILGDDGPVQTVSLVYAPRAGALRPSRVTGVALLVQTYGPNVTPMLEKTVAANGHLDSLRIAGHDAYWLGGEPHGFAYSSPAGGGFERQRLADHTLLVAAGSSLLRIEGGVTRAQAVAIARSALGGA
jgi:hypothetical protein